ncbi:hypothetical protein [Nocardiopsis halophila]|uniref:hypothetical protein n=1 Tax=Nocardiopsis halophila TaxID=141692 RepID=UPI00037007C4
MSTSAPRTHHAAEQTGGEDRPRPVGDGAGEHAEAESDRRRYRQVDDGADGRALGTDQHRHHRQHAGHRHQRAEDHPAAET